MSEERKAPKLTYQQLDMLSWLDEVGACVVDSAGDIIGRGPRVFERYKHGRDHASTILWLAAHGLVSGIDGKLVVSELGLDVLNGK